MSPHALVVWGGWSGHEPENVANFFAELLQENRFEVTVSGSMDAFLGANDPGRYQLIVPVITMSTITPEQCQAVTRAVSEQGVGIAGCHGGMCDTFRTDTEWQFMTGGQWVAHPGDSNVRYQINVNGAIPHPITNGIEDFEVVSEQYYLHVDPGNVVLATTDFPNPAGPGPHVGNPCKMPQVWIKSYGSGRVFYNALGHNREVLEAPEPRELMRRGFLWAAKGVGLG